MIAMLLSDAPGAEAFLRSHFDMLSQLDGTVSTCFSFSQGADFGTFGVSLNSVPGPSALALVPLSVFALRRRR
jgi:hypothetical protein